MAIPIVAALLLDPLASNLPAIRDAALKFRDDVQYYYDEYDRARMRRTDA